MPTSDSTKRAIKIAKDALERKGHKVVPFFLNEEECIEI